MKIVLRVNMIDDFSAPYIQSNEYARERRMVEIELTQAQAALLHPRQIGISGGKEVLEKRGEFWIEELP